MAVEHDCLGVEQDLADEEEKHDVALRLLQCVQEVFGDIVRGKDNDGGNLMALIDKLLREPEVKRRMRAFDAARRLAGTREDLKPLSYVDERAVAVLEEARSAIKVLLPFVRRPELHHERGIGEDAKKAIEKILLDSGNWSA